MDKEIVVISGDLEQTEERIRQLVNRILAPMESVIDIIAVKVDQNKNLPLATFDFHCTILLKIESGATIRVETHDCDGILAVHRALEKIVDQIQLQDVYAGNNVSERVE